jgi:hypothetical protein
VQIQTCWDQYYAIMGSCQVPAADLLSIAGSVAMHTKQERQTTVATSTASTIPCRHYCTDVYNSSRIQVHAIKATQLELKIDSHHKC